MSYEKFYDSAEVERLKIFCYEAGRKAERERILGLEVMRDESEGKTFELSKPAYGKVLERNALRATLREAINANVNSMETKAIGDSDE